LFRSDVVVDSEHAQDADRRARVVWGNANAGALLEHLVCAVTRGTRFLLLLLFFDSNLCSGLLDVHWRRVAELMFEVQAAGDPNGMWEDARC
jgi:hypothetical protein